MQDQFNQLISSDLPGIILIRLITDQFNQITEALEHLVAYFAQHPAQHEWEATILDAKNLIRNKTLDSSILRKLLFLRQLEAISSFLSLIRSNAVAFISNEQSINASPKMHSEEELAKPIKVFITTFIQEVLLGVPSYATGRVSCELFRLASRVELSGKVDFGARLSEIISERFDDDQRQQAAQVIDNYDRVWKTSDLTGRITRAIQLTESSLARAEQQRRSFQWLHDDILGLFFL